MTFLAAIVCFVLALLCGFVSAGAFVGGGINSVEAKMGLAKQNGGIHIIGYGAGLASNVFVALGVWIAVSG